MAAHDTVQVAVRVRPLNNIEIERGSRLCLDVHKNESQIVIKSTNQGFTYNYVFSDDTSQDTVYETAVKDMLTQLFKGYNITILAYGQTGSGKTFTMGTNYVPGNSYSKGIIPFAVEDMFRTINNDPDWEYTVTASFIELYQEQLYDLLSGRSRDASVVDIREDTRGVCIPNLTEKTITCTEETFQYLQQGSLCRATGATAMNAQSSRSHAIFTISLNINKKDNIDDAMTAKFHLVDLAGSERSKKTQAVGERFKEGVNINKGLLALGKVVSALGEGGHGFISYRESKLTRILQDSLGGNSQTLMIACVSPADYNQSETISTLRYADRARKITNRPIINQDPKVAENAKLKKEVESLRAELLSLQAKFGQNVVATPCGDGGDCNPTLTCPPEHGMLEDENASLKLKLKKLMDAFSDSVHQNYQLSERALIAEKARDRMNQKLAELDVEYSHTLESFNQSKDIYTTEPLQELHLKIREIQAEQKRSEEEILNHDMHSSITVAQGEENKFDNEGKCPDTPKDEVEYRENYMFEQAELNKEIQVLTKNLAYKEELAKKLLASSGFMADTGTDSEGQIKDLQEQIANLQHEKDELSVQIKSMHNNNVGNKLAEQRRKRLQELEQKLTLLNKKVTEQARVIKMKEKSDEKIVNLNKEIMSMKQAKVRLIQQMKFESERFRTMKTTRERELCKLREQDRRRQNQMIRMETLHNKQQNVLKRKVEEAAAANKRLKDALALKSAAQERLGSGKTDRFLPWVDQELEVLVSTAEAERTLDQLSKDRRALNDELFRLRQVLADGEISSEERKKLQSEIASLTQDIELRRTQIADMQQKIMDSNQESKLNNHVDQLNSLMEARNIVKYLFTLATEAKKEVSAKQYMIVDIQEAYNELEEKIKAYDKQIAEVRAEHERALIKLEKESQDKVYLLLNQLHGKDKNILSDETNNHLLERINILNEQLEKMDILRQENDNLLQQVEELKKQHIPKKLKPVVAVKQQKVYKDLDDLDDLVNDDDDYDDKNDPDWRNTPVAKRLMELKAKSFQSKNAVPVKRGSDGAPKCNCKLDCARKQCSCRKAGSSCGSKCRCDENCKNRNISSDSLASLDNSDSNSDNSFKKPRPLSPLHDIVNVKRAIDYDD